MAPQYQRLTRDLFIVQVKANRGWRDLQESTSSAAAYAALQAYRIDWGSGYHFRIFKRRCMAKEQV